jgi:hypothetical protein
MFYQADQLQRVPAVVGSVRITDQSRGEISMNLALSETFFSVIRKIREKGDAGT